ANPHSGGHDLPSNNPTQSSLQMPGKPPPESTVNPKHSTEPSLPGYPAPWAPCGNPAALNRLVRSPAESPGGTGTAQRIDGWPQTNPTQSSLQMPGKPPPESTVTPKHSPEPSLPGYPAPWAPCGNPAALNRLVRSPAESPGGPVPPNQMVGGLKEPPNPHPES